MKGKLFKPWKHQFIREHPDLEIQTRKVIYPQPIIRKGVMRWEKSKTIDINMDDHADLAIPYARYQVGEVVYIKEAWYQRPDGGVSYKLDFPDAKVGEFWTPLFMPAWAARDFIRILDVRPERLQEITEEDAIAEGITISKGTHQPIERDAETGKLKVVGEPQPYTARYHFEALWDSINPKYPWEMNPWVWKYCFKYLTRQEMP